MKNNTQMAKVIMMTIKLNNSKTCRMVATVDPAVTPEMFMTAYNLTGTLIDYETTSEMPLPFALAYSYRKYEELGIDVPTA